MNAKTDAPACEDFALTALDGYPLKASSYPASSNQFIVIAGATAVPRGFYRRFAQYAQSRNFNVITTDYRGIGDSMPASKPLRGFEMDYADWSRYDLAAAVKWASERSGGKVWIVGHSLGGHALGQLPRPQPSSHSAEPQAFRPTRAIRQFAMTTTTGTQP